MVTVGGMAVISFRVIHRVPGPVGKNTASVFRRPAGVIAIEYSIKKIGKWEYEKKGIV